MKILFIAGREVGYGRNDVILRALHRIGDVEVLGVIEKPRSLALTSLILTMKAFPRLGFGKFDIVFVGFFGHLIMVPVGILASQPVIFDALLSVYDTLIEDRQVVARSSLIAHISWWLDFFACRLADQVLLDTRLHGEYFSEQFQQPIKKFVACPVGCNEDIFYPREIEKPHIRTCVTYYTSYLPLHGVDIVVRAAALLRSHPIHFRIIGRGLTYEPVRKLAEEMRIGNIEFLPEMPIGQIAEEIANADICLGGHFGPTLKAARVVPSKVYQILAMERALIATCTAANLELLRHRESAYLCPPNDPEALAGAIQILHEDPQLRIQLARRGRILYETTCSEAIITDLLRKTILELIPTG